MLNVVLDIGFTYFLSHSRGKIYKDWNNIIHDTIDADLLVMGSSRAKRQYDPRIMDSLLSINSYNIGRVGSNVKQQIVKYEVYRHYQRKKPSFLIVNFDCIRIWGRNSRYEREQFFPYITNLYMRKLIKKNEEFSIGELYVPMYRYYSQGFLWLINSANAKNDEFRECWYKGYGYCSSEWDGTALENIKSKKFNPLQDTVDEFDAFLSELQQDGVKVIFVSPPIYIGVTEKIVNLSEFYDFRKRFSEKYDIPVLDYFYDSISYNTACFHDAWHLNKTGAELFTTKLCHDLDSLGLLK